MIKRKYFALPAAAAAKSLQSCPTLCDPRDGSPPGSPVPEILQARTLEWVAISFSNAWKWKVKVKSLSRVRLLVTPWTAAHQAPPSLGFSRQEYWSGVPLPSPLHCLRHAKILRNVRGRDPPVHIQIMRQFPMLKIATSKMVRSDQSLSRVGFFATPWIAARQASLSITNSRSSLRLRSIQSVMPSSHLILCPPLLLPPIPSSIWVFATNNRCSLLWDFFFKKAKISEFSLIHLLWVFIMNFDCSDNCRMEIFKSCIRGPYAVFRLPWWLRG